MKKVFLPLIIWMSICTILFYACQREMGFPSDGLSADQLVIASVQGRVTDKSGIPVQNAKVISGEETTFTDINGTFSFTDIKLSTRFGYVKVEKDGYFTGSRSIITNPSSSNFIEIELMDRVLKGNFSASTGGIITVEAGQTVAFEASSVINEQTGADYAGDVKVYASYIDPTNATFNRRMPGDLRGLNTQGIETGMLSYGMLAVELEGAAGEKLQLTKGKAATLSMTIPSSLQTSAPASIPLWYFDESTGKWMEEGAAGKQGNKYVGTVAHFTTWNVDVPLNFSNLKGQFETETNLPIAYTLVKITDTRNNLYGITYTDAAGKFKTWVPKEGTLKLELINMCGEVMTTKNIGPYSSDADLGISKVAVDEAQAVTFNGSVNDCSGNSVQKGHVIITLEGIKHKAAIQNGLFNITIPRCQNTTTAASFLAVDETNMVQGTIKSLNVSSGTVSAGLLEACGTSSRVYIEIELDGTRYTIEDNDSLSISKRDTLTYLNIMSAYQPQFDIMLYASIPGTTSGDFNGMLEILQLGSKVYYYSPLTFKLTTYGAVGEFVTGSFSGVVKKDSSSQSETLNGSFRIRRDK